MSILHKIHAQPDHIRELIAGICTVVVVIVIGIFWANSFKHTVYATLNPDQQTQTDQPLFANISTPSSLFGYIAQGVSSGKAEIFSLFNNFSNSTSVDNSQPSGPAAQPQGQVHPLPVTGNR